MSDLPILLKVGILVSIELALIGASFGYLALFQVEDISIGNSINIAGKNRFLTANVLLQSEYFMAGETEVGSVHTALDNLESNINLLRYGGKMGIIEAGALPPEFAPEWENLYQNYLTLNSSFDELTIQGISPSERADRIKEMRESGASLIDSSDSLVTNLGVYAKNNANKLFTLQLTLGSLNMGTALLITVIILRLITPIKNLAKAAKLLTKGNLDIKMPSSGGVELRQLSEAFDSVIASFKAEREKYFQLFEGASDLYSVTDTNGILIDCNQSYLRNLGYSSKDELIGKSILYSVSQDSLSAMMEAFEVWKNTGEVTNREVWLKRKDNSNFPTLVSATAIRDRDGKIVKSNTCIIDITEMHKTRKALEDANKRLMDADNLKTEFISIASHELRTPIQPILGYAMMARLGKVGNEEAWDAVLTAARRLQQLSNDILDVTKIESHNLRLNLDNIRIHELLANIINSVRLNSKKDILLDLVSDRDSENLELKLDRSRITQVFTNILENAIKFTDHGKIIVSCDVDQTFSKIRITDTGAGIPADIVPVLFTKFATKNHGQASGQGTGLGLYISKAIVEAHGGNIKALNNESGGATFEITLPHPKAEAGVSRSFPLQDPEAV